MKFLLICCLFISNTVYGSKVNKIISTAPSITETIYALGQGKKIVGVTPFCSYPMGGKSKKVIGTALNLDFEEILKVIPDLIFLSSSAPNSTKEKLKKLSLKFDIIKHDSLDDIFNSIYQIGKVLSVPDRSEKLIKNINKTFALNKAITKKKILIIIGTELKANAIVMVISAGAGTFYDDILKKMFLTNIHKGKAMYPRLGIEEILLNRPEVIINLLPRSSFKQAQETAKEWAKFSKLTNINNINILFADYALLPGPRVGRLVEKIGEILREDNVNRKKSYVKTWK